MGSIEITSATPEVISRSDHCISRADISESALEVLYRLKDSGFQAYLVGGGVRDLLLGREPKDFDVVTDAHPEQVRKLFRNCRLIGRRFRLAHVRFGRQVIEVATFRAALAAGNANQGEAILENGRIIRDNVYGSIEEDALRRDFTVNSLYYNISDYSVLDYVGAITDLRAGVLRMIGDPQTRFREDPVRMLRAIRFAAKLGFRIHPGTETPIFKMAHYIPVVPAARLFDEIMKLFHSGCAAEVFVMLRRYGLFGRLFPATEQSLAQEDHGFPITFVSNALRNTDERINGAKPVTPAFLFAVLLWEPVRHRAQYYLRRRKPQVEALQNAIGDVVAEQVKRTAIPRRFAVPMREIWLLQPRFMNKSGKRPRRLHAHPRFRAAYDFLCLRAAAGEDLSDDCQWWTEFQQKEVKPIPPNPVNKALRTRRYRRRSSARMIDGA